MIGRVLLAAVLAGIVAGISISVVQMWRVTPLIVEAESYEGGGAAHDHAHDAAAGGAEAEAPEHGDDAWMPVDGAERTIYTVLSNILVGVGFGLVLVAAALVSGREITPANGVLWGLLGFLAFSLAPAAGLPPELPGMAAADLSDRQAWWVGTVVATVAGIGAIALLRPVYLKAAGLALILIPHIIGAPVPESHESAVPAGLAAEFAAVSLAGAALFWVVLGVTAGWFLSNETAEAAT